jgi:hypothetical protein
MERMPELFNNLTMAEGMRLSMDYMTQDAISESLIQFYMIYADDLEHFGQKIADYCKASSEHGERQASYNDIHFQARFDNDDAMQIALRAAGVATMHSRRALGSVFDELSEEGSGISQQLARHIAKYHEDETQIIINGVPYGILEGHISKRLSSGEKIRNRTLVFAAGEDLQTITRNLYDWNDNGTINGVGVAPTIQDWQMLLFDITTAAKF